MSISSGYTPIYSEDWKGFVIPLNGRVEIKEPGMINIVYPVIQHKPNLRFYVHDYVENASYTTNKGNEINSMYTKT